jgi:hypothetical protein
MRQCEQQFKQVREHFVFNELADKGLLLLSENEDVSERSHQHLEHLIVRAFAFEFLL